MKRRFWIAGANKAQRFWPVAIAFAFLIAAYVSGALVLLPVAEPLFIDDAALASPVVELPEIRIASNPVEDPAPIPKPEIVAPVVAKPDACMAAMAAALSNARIEFLSSSVEIIPASRNVISVLAALSHACQGQIVIAGHSDNLGPEVANQQISVARAQSVADTFVEFGVEPERLSVIGYGSSQPVADNQTREGRARNRRIEMTLVEEISSE